MRDAARNLRPPSGSWTPSTQLRYKNVNFIKSVEHSEAEPERVQPREEGPFPTADVVQTQQGSNNKPSIFAIDPVPIATNGHTQEQPLTDTTRHANDLPHADRRSPTPSGSDEEVVVFTGRKRPQQALSSNSSQPVAAEKPPEKPAWDNTLGTWVHRSELKRAKPRPAPSAKPPPTLTARQNEKAQPQNPPGWRQAHQSQRALAEQSITALLDDAKIEQEEFIRFDNSPKPSRRAGKRPMRSTRNRRDIGLQASDITQSQAVLDDYVANLKASGEVEDSWEDESSGPNEAQPEEVDGWAQSDLEALADLSTSDEILGAVSRILSKRERPNGTQYLVVWEGQTADEARWVPHVSLNIEEAQQKIYAFEVQLRKTIEMQQQADVSEDSEDLPDDDDDDVDDDSDEDDEFDDEIELEQRRIAKMSDEQIARLLSKQEELGLGSDELMLFAADAAEDSDPNPYAPMNQRSPYASRHAKKTAKRSISAHTDQDSTLGPDDYSGFDVMDWERPSLAKPSKSKTHAAMPFDLSDSSLERSLQNSFAHDRATKKAKKQEREDLRAQGFLGSGSKSKSKRNTSTGGPPLRQIREQLEDFLDDPSAQQMPLAPMDKKDRKMIHVIASNFGCKSKSAGSGKTRYPVVYKSARTMSFNADVFDRMETKLLRGFFPRAYQGGNKGDGGTFGKAGAGRLQRGSQRGAPQAGMRYREGETVGAAAAELGVENRGHAMLQKMGWSKGMALGLGENKGILMPVEHVIKTGRGGLG